MSSSFRGTAARPGITLLLVLSALTLWLTACGGGRPKSLPADAFVDHLDFKPWKGRQLQALEAVLQYQAAVARKIFPEMAKWTLPSEGKPVLLFPMSNLGPEELNRMARVGYFTHHVVSISEDATGEMRVVVDEIFESPAPTGALVRQSVVSAYMVTFTGEGPRIRSREDQPAAPADDHPARLAAAVRKQIEAGDLPGARAAIQAAMEKFPGQWDLVYLDTMLKLQETRDPAEAMKIQAGEGLTWLSAVDPQAAHPRADLAGVVGDLLRSKGDTAGAKEWYSKAIALEPGLVPARMGLARLANDAGDENGAREHLTAAYNAIKGLEPIERLLFGSQAYDALAAGFAQAQAQDGPAAVQSFHQAAQAAPAWDKPWINLGMLAHSTGDTAAAEELFRKAVATGYRPAETRMYLARVLSETGRQDEALAVYREVLTTAPWQGEALNAVYAAEHPAGAKPAGESTP